MITLEKHFGFEIENVTNGNKLIYTYTYGCGCYSTWEAPSDSITFQCVKRFRCNKHTHIQ